MRKKLDSIYLVFGDPFMHPKIFKQVQHAYSYVSKNKPKKTKLLLKIEELKKTFRGNVECMEIVIDTKVDRKRHFIVIYKGFTRRPDMSDLPYEFEKRDEKYVKKLWKDKFSEKNDIERILTIQNKIRVRIEQSMMKRISQKLLKRLDLEDKKEERQKSKNANEEVKPYKRMDSSLEIISTALKLRTKLDRQKRNKYKLIKKKKLN